MNDQNRAANQRNFVNILQQSKISSSQIDEAIYLGKLKLFFTSNREKKSNHNKGNLIYVKPECSLHRIHDSKTGQDWTVKNYSPQTRQPDRKL